MNSVARQPSAPARRPTILICDDDRELLVELERFLVRQKFLVLSASSVDGALELLDIWKVSAVIFELTLNGLDSALLVRAVHAWHRGVACIALTNRGCEKAKELGIPCIHKEDPGSRRELVSKLRASLGYGPNG